MQTSPNISKEVEQMGLSQITDGSEKLLKLFCKTFKFQTKLKYISVTICVLLLST